MEYNHDHPDEIEADVGLLEIIIEMGGSATLPEVEQKLLRGEDPLNEKDIAEINLPKLIQQDENYEFLTNNNGSYAVTPAGRIWIEEMSAWRARKRIEIVNELYPTKVLE